jgi:hypothetical protein
MDDIIKLIDLSLEDGKLNPDEYRIILSKAQAQGISEEEFNLILAKRTKKAESTQTTPLQDKKSDASDFFVMIEKEFNQTISKITQSSDNPSNVSAGDTVSKLPYILASIAVVFTFFDWVKAYSHTNVMGNTGSFDMSFSGWWGGYGASIVIIYAAGCYYYNKGNRYFWLAGLLAVADAAYIYSSLSNSDVSISSNYGGYGASTEAGYELLWGFWAFILASFAFAMSGFMINKSALTLSEIINRLITNLNANKKIHGIAIISSSIVIAFIMNYGDIGERIFSGLLFSLILSFITLLVVALGPSSKLAAMISFGIIIIISLLADESLDIFLLLGAYPISYIVVEKVLASGIKFTSNGNIGVFLLFCILQSGCSDQSKMKFQTDSSESIDGTYIAVDDGFESSLTVIGNTWFGTNKGTNFGNIMSSGSGKVENNRIYDENGVELGSISNGKAYVNIGGMELILRKE